MRTHRTPELDELVVTLGSNEAFQKLLTMLRMDAEKRAVRFMKTPEISDWDRGIVCGELNLINILSDWEGARKRLEEYAMHREIA